MGIPDIDHEVEYDDVPPHEHIDAEEFHSLFDFEDSEDV